MRRPGNSIFFSVKRIEDPIGLLPAKLILGINKARPALPGPASLLSLPFSWRSACRHHRCSRKAPCHSDLHAAIAGTLAGLW
jgi:hypothetical protein